MTGFQPSPCSIKVVPYSQTTGSPYTGNMQACLRHKRRDTIRRRRQVTKLPRPFPQYPPFSQRYRFLRMRCCVLALPMPFTGQGALGLRCDRGRMTSGMSSFLAGRHSQAVFASGPIPQQRGACILDMNGAFPRYLSRYSDCMAISGTIKQ